MDDDYKHNDSQDMAQLGYDPAHQGSPEGDENGQAEHGERDSLEEGKGLVKEDGALGSPDIAEYHEATPDERAEMLIARSWRGLLPAPEDFNQYPEHVQQKIVAWASDSVSQQQRLTDSAIEMDKADSSRLDRLLLMEEKERKFGQAATVVLDAAIIVGVVYTAAIDQPIVATSLAAVLAGINAFSIFGKRAPEKPGKSEEDARPTAHDEKTL